VGAAKDGGMRGLILTCKHQDGFCLWPSRYTEHSVKNSPFGRDVVKEISSACARQGLRVRLRIAQAPVCPAISEVGLFVEPG